MAKNIRKSHGSKQERAWQGITLLSYGFRPFFLFGPLFAMLAMINWLLLLDGRGIEPGSLTAQEWHMHEMLFGYSSALIAGFLLTAIPNWTGRFPVKGWPLLVLALIWLAGRVAMLLPLGLSPAGLAAIDAVFLPYFGAVIAREIIVSKNWRNVKVLMPILVMSGANIWFHFDTISGGGGEGAIRLGFAGVLFLVMIIGGRIIPSFTRNWLARQEPGKMPVVFSRFDIGVLVVSGIGMLWWVVDDSSATLGAGLAFVGVLHVLRLSRWAGLRTVANPLLIVLHVFYGFIPLGFITLGGAVAFEDFALRTAAFHLFGVGVIGGMTVVVSLRAILGHTGRELVADRRMVAIFVLITLAALVRASGAVLPGLDWLITLAGLIWIAAFALITFHVGPWLLAPRLNRAG